MTTTTIPAGVPTMRAISWISFDHTVPVPVLRDGFLISRSDIPLLFPAPENEIRWEKDCIWVQWVHGCEWHYSEADRLERVEVEGAELYRIGTAPFMFQFNDDTESMAGLGYRTSFAPGEGIVVENPDPAAPEYSDRTLTIPASRRRFLRAAD